MIKAILYEIVNSKNRKRYIGVTTMTIKQRWCVHLYKIRHSMATDKIQEAFNEYGESSFYINQLSSGDLDNMLLMEKELTKETIINGYNTIIGGGDSEERSSSAKIFHEKLKNNPEYKSIFYKNISHKNTGKRRSFETKRKMSIAKLGVKWLEAHKNNRSKQYSGNGNPNAGNCKIFLNTQTGIFYSTPEMLTHFNIVKRTLTEWYKKSDARIFYFLKT
jgi:hypothetical protein